MKDRLSGPLQGTVWEGSNVVLVKVGEALVIGHYLCIIPFADCPSMECWGNISPITMFAWAIYSPVTSYKHKHLQIYSLILRSCLIRTNHLFVVKLFALASFNVVLMNYAESLLGNKPRPVSLTTNQSVIFQLTFAPPIRSAWSPWRRPLWIITVFVCSQTPLSPPAAAPARDHMNITINSISTTAHGDEDDEDDEDYHNNEDGCGGQWDGSHCWVGS